MLPEAERARLRTAVSAVLYGSIWDGFNGPTGITKDEALDYAAELAWFVKAQLDEKAEPHEFDGPIAGHSEPGTTNND